MLSSRGFTELLVASDYRRSRRIATLSSRGFTELLVASDYRRGQHSATLSSRGFTELLVASDYGRNRRSATLSSREFTELLVASDYRRSQLSATHCHPEDSPSYLLLVISGKVSVALHCLPCHPAMSKVSGFTFTLPCLWRSILTTLVAQPILR